MRSRMENLSPEELRQFIDTKQLEQALNRDKQIAPNLFAPKRILPKLYPTRSEALKMKRAKRKEFIRNKNERIKLGLEAPPPQKIKLQNIPLIVENNPGLNPSKLESQARQLLKERQEKHAKHNENRKLTKLQKR